jgi:hypothetical protein
MLLSHPIHVPFHIPFHCIALRRFIESTVLLKEQIDIGTEQSTYPPYIFAEFNFFRMGGGAGGTSGVVPAHLAVGREVAPGVRRVIKKNKLFKMSSFTEAPPVN